MPDQPLSIVPELLHQLRLFRTQREIAIDPIIHRSDLDRVEADLGVPLKTELVAYLAMMGRTVDLVADLTERLREDGMPRRLVAFATDVAGFWWCMGPDRELLVTFPRGEAAPDSLAVVVRRLRVQDAMQRDIALVTETMDRSEPRLRVPDPSPDRWVEHPRFGRGRIVAEPKDSPDAVIVEFDDGRRRRILAARVSRL